MHFDRWSAGRRATRRSASLAAAAVVVALATGCPSARSSAMQPATPASAAAPPAASAPTPTASGAARVAMLDLAFYGKRANSLEPGDPGLAVEGTRRVRAQILDSDGVVLLDSAAVAAAQATPAVLAAAQGKECNVVIACARAVGQSLGVPWVVTGKVSKTSNLIWIFSGQLINVATGELVMDDEYELKGDAHDMVAAGARAFARRVVRKVGGEPRS
jgi:hypothetical protein